MRRQHKIGEDMVNNVTNVWTNMIASISTVTSIFWGRVLAICLFLGATFSEVSGLIHTILLLVLIDMIFGIFVTVKKKGKDQIESNKLRNSLYKASFYLMFIMSVFLIEKQTTTDTCLLPRVVFAVMGAVELWSISANALILMPKMPFLRLFRKYLVSEIGKKLEIDKDKVEDILIGIDMKYKTHPERFGEIIRDDNPEWVGWYVIDEQKEKPNFPSNLKERAQLLIDLEYSFFNEK